MQSILEMDETIFFWINVGWSSPFLDRLMILATIAGDAVVWIVVGILFIYLKDNSNFKRRVIIFLLSMIIGGAVMQGVKYTADRDRPLALYKKEIIAGRMVINTPMNRLETRSFPSGHTQAAFSAAMFFVLYYRRLKALLILAAIAVGVSRVYLGTHFPLDVLGGASIGAGISWLIWRYDMGNLHHDQDKTKVSAH